MAEWREERGNEREEGDKGDERVVGEEAGEKG